jgi:xylulokinase
MPDRAPAILVFDLGLTNCKGLVFSFSGEVLGQASAAYKTYFPRPGSVEQDPDEWWRAVCLAAQQLWEAQPDLADRIEAISVTGHMHALVALGRVGQTLKPALVLGDQRSLSAARKITQSLGLPAIYQITGARMDASMPAAKILWLKETDPQILADTQLFVGCKDYIRHQLTEDRYTDPIDACATSLYDLEKGRWSPELMSIAGVEPGQLPEIVPPTHMAGPLLKSAARALGLREGIPVVVGSGDDVEVLGNGLLKAGSSLEHLGTTGSILTCADQPIYDPEMALELYPHAQPGLWVIGGSITTAGSALAWASGLLGYQTLESAFSVLLSEDCNSEDILVFLPHLLGERSPAWQPGSRGSWIGLTTTHSPSDLMRAAFEGTVYALKHILDRIESLVGEQRLITVASRGDDEHWLKLRADIYARPLGLIRSTEPTALGAMILALTGIGACADLPQAVKTTTHIDQLLIPEKKRTLVYQRPYSLYKLARETVAAYWSQARELTVPMEIGQDAG